MSTTPPTSRPGRRSPFQVSGWPLRRKLALALTIPLLLAATLGGLRVRSDLTEASNSSATSDQVTVLRPAVTYLTVAERAMVAAQSGSTSNEAALADAVEELQTAADQLTDARTSAGLTPEQSNQVDVVLDLSRSLREAGTETLSPGTWVAQLRQLQSATTRLVGAIANAQIVPEPRLELLAQTLGGRFSLAMQQALVATDRSGDTGSQELFSELGVEGAAIDRLAGALGSSEPAVAALRTENAQRSREIRTGGTDLGGGGAYTQYDSLVTTLMDGIDQSLSTSATDARTRALANAAITLVALLAALLLAFVVSRLLLTPIRKVREGALAVAHEELPEAVARIRAGEEPGEIKPIDVTTQEEMGQLARAVDDMHQQAVRLATGEASLRAQVGEMFVTLSRRNTSLINQQLSLIETLEKDEEDPRRLESLFRLDHLASRMRRTADSLLILADAPAPAIGQADLTVADALQAATSGVQDYQRVQVDANTSARISDDAAADVVHLLTELVDNALSYSSPSTSVKLRSTPGPNGVQIEVIDQGLGIPESALPDLNATLHSGGDVTPDTARRMGLFVVSRLAQRHLISVMLRRNPQAGITATVFLPSSILPGFATPAAPAPKAQATPDTAPAGMPSRTPASRPVGVPAAVDPLPTRVPASVGSAGSDSPDSVDSIEARIHGALGLPRRQPGSTVAPAAAPPTPAAPAAVAPAAAPTVPPAAVAAVVMSTPTAAELATARATSTAPETTPETATETATGTATGTTQPADVIPIRAHRPADALDGSSPFEDKGEAETDTPIFKAMRSAWLTSNGGDQPWQSSEVEEGWTRADSVADAPTERRVTPAGLPARRPGSMLVPGGVTRPTVATRDPEAIRKRLAAHAAGVSRGRSAATTPHPEHTEAGPA